MIGFKWNIMPQCNLENRQKNILTDCFQWGRNVYYTDSIWHARQWQRGSGEFLLKYGKVVGIVLHSAVFLFQNSNWKGTYNDVTPWCKPGNKARNSWATGGVERARSSKNSNLWSVSAGSYVANFWLTTFLPVVVGEADPGTACVCAPLKLHLPLLPDLWAGFSSVL